MTRVLILRSVSLQQLDVGLPAIVAAFPGSAFDLVTHPHAVAECRKYEAIDQVVPLDSGRPFSPFRIPATVRRTRYDAVVVPVANRSGAGFLNVFVTAWATGARRLYVCNLTSEIRAISRWEIAARTLGAQFCHLAAIVAMAAAAPVALGWMLASRLISGVSKATDRIS